MGCKTVAMGRWCLGTEISEWGQINVAGCRTRERIRFGKKPNPKLESLADENWHTKDGQSNLSSGIPTEKGLLNRESPEFVAPPLPFPFGSPNRPSGGNEINEDGAKDLLTRD